MNSPSAVAATFRARIDRNTRKLVLPVPVSGLARFSIQGVWRDFASEGPDPTVVIVKARAKIAKRTIEHRLTEDASFPLPETVQHVELEVQYPSDHARLEVSITPIEPGPTARQRSLERYLERRAA
ncbi:MAG: hypothetical protein FD144_4225 [Rhodospirillaceae bacterium]|nr:MAG: hypothetical protein FD144_4225 [Rhodospirillaceae bacterium]